MSEEKRKNNGWLPYYEHGFVGIKDNDENIIVSPDLGYTEIGELKENTAIARKEDKCYLINGDGIALCSAYDRLVYIGVGYYKGGILVHPNDHLVVEYQDTSFVYETYMRPSARQRE